jgi:lysophospholipase L1-like esterase
VKIFLVILATLVGLLVLLEVGLRLLGFGNPPIYIADEQIGYLLAPNQRTRRLGNRMEINQYSMRSDPIARERPDSTLRIFLLGDSVANGAWWTDGEQTISAKLRSQLQDTPSASAFDRTEVLNASANSWGPRNELAYLQRFGTFGAQVVVVLINTDDLFAKAPTAAPVGREQAYPDRKPPFAIAEALSRLFPPSTPPAPPTAKPEAAEKDPVGINLEAIRQIQSLARDAGAECLLAMTPLLREIGEPGPRDYEIKARSRLDEFARQQQLTYVDFLPLFNNTENPQTLYRDHIHLSPQGNEAVSQEIGRSLQPLLPATASPATTTP